MLIRLQELNPGVGEYFSFKKTDTGVLVITTTGHLNIPSAVLEKQFQDPESITSDELTIILDTFKLSIVN